MLVDALGLGRGGEPPRRLRIGGEELSRPLQLLARALCLRRQFGKIACSFFLRLFPHALRTAGAERWDLGMPLSDEGEHRVHVLLALEGALLLRAVVILHHKVGNTAERAFARKAALTHRHALEHAAHSRKGHIIVPVDKKAVQIQRLFTHAAGAEALAGLFVLCEDLRRKRRSAETYRCKDHNRTSKEFLAEKAAGGKPSHRFSDGIYFFSVS